MIDSPLSPPDHKHFVLIDIGNGGNVRLEVSALGGGEIMLMFDSECKGAVCIIVMARDLLHGLINLICLADAE